MKKTNSYNPKVLLYNSTYNNKIKISNANKINSPLMDLSKQLKNISINDTHILKILTKNKSVISSFRNKKDYQTMYDPSQCSKKYLDTEANESSNTIFYNEAIPTHDSQFMISTPSFKVKRICSFSMNGISPISSIRYSNKEDLYKENFSLKENIKFLLNQIKKYQKNESNIDNDNIEPENMIFEIKKEFEDKINYYISEIKKYKKEIKLLKEQNNKLKAENKELEKLINVNKDNVDSNENLNTFNNKQNCVVGILNPDSPTYPVTNYMKFCRNNIGKNLSCINKNYNYNGNINNANSIKNKIKKTKILRINSNKIINNSNIIQRHNFNNNICNTQDNNNNNQESEYIVVINKSNNLADSNSNREHSIKIPKTQNNNIKFIINTSKNNITKNEFMNSDIIKKSTPLFLYRKIDNNKIKIGNIEYIKPGSLRKIGCICATPTVMGNKSQGKIIKNIANELFVNEKNNYNGIKLDNYIGEKMYYNLRNNQNSRKKLSKIVNNTFSKEGI